MKNIAVEQLAALTEPQLIDVREPDEFVAGHAVGAINVPLGSLASAPVPDESATVYVICQSGGRSLRGVEALTARGIDAVNVEGGTSAWMFAGAARGVGTMSLFRRTSVSVDRARELLAEGWQLLDVRTAQEWKSDHVTGALHIPLDTLDRSLGRLKKSDQIVTICHSGMRSAIAARTLRRNGWNAVTVRGGMMAWRRK